MLPLRCAWLFYLPLLFLSLFPRPRPFAFAFLLLANAFVSINRALEAHETRPKLNSQRTRNRMGRAGLGVVEASDSSSYRIGIVCFGDPDFFNCATYGLGWAGLGAYLACIHFGSLTSSFIARDGVCRYRREQEK